jgi:flagellar hook-associated protein 1 FlgK
MDSFDELIYELASQFNASHYAGYGIDDYEDVTGLAFFDLIKSRYGAFGKLKMDPAALFDQSRVASASGDGKGHSMGYGDGSNALEIARLKQAKLFMGGTADFNDLYRKFVADVGSFGQRASQSLSTENYILEQVSVQRDSVMGVNSSEEMLNLVEMNNEYKKSAQYISSLFQVIDKIINGVGRVGI